MVASPTLVKRRDIACLRGLLLIAFGGILFEAGAVAAGTTALALLIGHGLTTLLLLSTPLHRIRFLKLELVLGVADVIAIGLAIQLAGAAGGALPVSCLMMVLVVALTNRRAHVVGGVAVVAAMHAWLIMGNPDMPARQLAPHLLFLGSIALYFSYLADGIHNHRKLRDAEELERKELQALLDILGTITSSLDLVVVTRAIVQKLSTVVQTTRCSMLFVNQDKSECFVIASHDDPELEMLETDLSKYPEIREAIETRNPVLIHDVSTDPRMQSVKGVLESLQVDLRSILVLPLVFGDELLGTLCIRAAHTRKTFNPGEVKFCTAVARASTNALKNVLLHRQVREESLSHRQLSEKLARVFDHSPGIVLTTDNDGRITELNARAEELLGLTRETLVGQSYTTLFEGHESDGLIDRVRENGSVSNYACRLKGSGTRVVEVELNLSVLRDEHGTLNGTVWIGRDVTELKSAQTQLLQAKKLSMIGEIISGVAHELNNPLSGVLGFSELMLMRGPGEPARADELEMIRDSALRCQKIVKNLLSFAREDHPKRQKQGINKILEKTLEMKEYQFHVNSIEVVRDLDPGLPTTFADFHQLQQVFLNLLNNAEQAVTANPRGPARITVRSRQVDDLIRVEISDDGPGMDPETLERIFDPFFTTKEAGHGTGLGLSVSYGIVNEHGGRIHASSRVGQGSTFFVELPIASAEKTAEDDGAAHVSRSEARPGSRILIVDDEPVILQLLVDLLEGRGYRIDTAGGGEEAWEMINRQGYDLVITDLRMPGMSGFQLYPRILARRPELEGRVIFITGDLVDAETEQFLLDAQACVLEKPLEIRRVVETVDTALARPVQIVTGPCAR